MPQGRPWEDFKQPAATTGGPWMDYQTAQPPVDNSAILAQQKAKYPTSAERGGKPGRAQISLLNTIIDTEPNAQTQMGAEAAFMGAAAPGNVFAKVPSAIETMAAPTARIAATAAEQLKAAPLVQAATSAANSIRKTVTGVFEKPDLAKIYNRAAGVKAGREGVQVDMSTGNVKTDPGRAAVRANESRSALGQLKDAFFAKPTEGLRVRVNQEFSRSNSALKSQLGQVKEPVDFTIPDIKKAHEAAGAAKLTADESGKVTGSALDLHSLRRELGDRINWNPNFVSEANEALKDSWIDLTKKLNAVGGPQMPKLNKDFQEAYLYQRALKHQFELKEAGKKTATSMANRAGKTAARTAIGGTVLYKGYRIFE